MGSKASYVYTATSLWYPKWICNGTQRQLSGFILARGIATDLISFFFFFFFPLQNRSALVP